MKPESTMSALEDGKKGIGRYLQMIGEWPSLKRIWRGKRWKRRIYMIGVVSRSSNPTSGPKGQRELRSVDMYELDR
jgi:hypothetical protein